MPALVQVDVVVIVAEVVRRDVLALVQVVVVALVRISAQAHVKVGVNLDVQEDVRLDVMEPVWLLAVVIVQRLVQVHVVEAATRNAQITVVLVALQLVKVR